MADATMIAGVMPAPRDVRIRGCAGSNSITLAVAATSMLTATPDAFVSESMPRPLLTTAPGNAVGGRSPRPGRRQHFLPKFRAVLPGTGRLRPVGSHHLPHLIMSGTMVYMLATVARPAQLSGAGAAGASRAAFSPPLSPRLASCCNIVMGLVMGYMLIISL